MNARPARTASLLLLAAVSAFSTDAFAGGVKFGFGNRAAVTFGAIGLAAALQSNRDQQTPPPAASPPPNQPGSRSISTTSRSSPVRKPATKVAKRTTKPAKAVAAITDKSTAPAAISSAAPVSPTQALPPTQTETRVALVIGEAGYRYVEKLTNPARDVETVATALRADGFKVTLADDLDRGQFVKTLQDFQAQADNADWAMVYYAGHGIEITGTNYLIPVDAKLLNDRDVADEAIALDRVVAAVEGARKLRLVVLDACRNNPFLAGMKRSVADRSIGRGLAPIEPSQATMIAYSAKAGSVASDGGGSNSPFAASLAKRLTQPGLELGKLFRQVRSDVLLATGNQQEPWLYGSLPPDDFFFLTDKDQQGGRLAGL